MGYLVHSAKQAKWAHEKTHRKSEGWDVGAPARAADEELRFNLHGYEMTEAFYGR
jgi:hypothetical protein